MGLAVVGLFLPLVPTADFLLLAAACYARASRRFYLWLLNSRTFGPTLRDWRRHRAISLRAKAVAIALVVVSIGTTTLLLARSTGGRIALAALGLGIVAILLRIPTRPPVSLAE